MEVCTEDIGLTECMAVWRRPRAAAPEDFKAERSLYRSCSFVADTGGRRLQTWRSLGDLDKETLF